MLGSEVEYVDADGRPATGTAWSEGPAARTYWVLPANGSSAHAVQGHVLVYARPKDAGLEAVTRANATAPRWAALERAEALSERMLRDAQARAERARQHAEYLEEAAAIETAREEMAAHWDAEAYAQCDALSDEEAADHTRADIDARRWAAYWRAREAGMDERAAYPLFIAESGPSPADMMAALGWRAREIRDGCWWVYGPNWAVNREQIEHAYARWLEGLDARYGVVPDYGARRWQARRDGEPVGEAPSPALAYRLLAEVA
ncbi:hypothetical protein [Occultella kanbiaonis]|uniref:hypothetical protein n=1 Tax=Occultella kanbiaonis TaxID=2675754 RepID=UPI0012B72105|nr:hypothetical protein [Occultella kanbiaonis]